MYDEISEDQYKTIVRGRLAQDDFIVDDGVQGYADNGVDDFEAAEQEEESDEGVSKIKCKASAISLHMCTALISRVVPKGKSAGKAKAKPPPPAVVPSISAYRKTVSVEQETDFMASLLGAMDSIPAKPSTKSRKRKPEPESNRDDGGSSPTPFGSTNYRKPSTTAYRGKHADADMSSDGLLEEGLPSGPSSDDAFFSPKKKLKTETVGLTPAIERMGKLGVYNSADDYDSSFDDIDMDAFMEVDEAEMSVPSIAKGKPSKTQVKSDADNRALPVYGNISADPKKQDSVPSWLSVYDSLSVAADDTLGSASSSRTTAAHSNLSVLEQDGSLRFFWLDYLEHEGCLYFVGKTQDKTSGAWISCCITVDNLQRNLFVLPRERRVEEDEQTGELYDTDVVPEMKDVYDDFDRIRKKIGIKSWKAKFVNRKYVFGDADVPRGETQWLKVVYSFKGMSSYVLRYTSYSVDAIC